MRDIDHIVSLNRIPPLGSQRAYSLMISGLTQSGSITGGWKISGINLASGALTYSHISGLSFRSNGKTGEINIDIPTNFRISATTVYGGPTVESVHYK